LSLHGSRIHAARQTLFEGVFERFRTVAERLLCSGLKLAGRLTTGMGVESADPEVWEERFQIACEREIAARRPLFGPHLAELEILLEGKPAREVASGSERKLLGLALVLAAAVAENALLLLDDFDSELDAAAAERLLRELSRFPAVIVTSSSALFRSSDSAPFFRLELGELQGALAP
jgi:recombinational DNA repair ATPase RecF